MYKAKGDFFNGLIRWWTGSQYSHCELIVRGVCYSSTIRDGGVRAKVMALPAARYAARRAWGVLLRSLRQGAGAAQRHAHEPAGAAGCLSRYQQKRSFYLPHMKGHDESTS
jgi:hypothetical protein